MKKINLDEYDIDINDDSFGLDVEAEPVEVNTSKAANLGFEWGHCIISAVVIVVILLTFVFRLVNIDGSSMLPTLVNSDKVIITNFFYEPEVGDIVVIPAGKYQELVDKIVDFVGTLNFDGLYDVDLIETKDGKMYFVELNMRFGGSGYAITESGVNLPAMYADYMLCGKPIDQNFRVEETGKVFVSEKMMMEEYSKGYLSVVRMREILKNADIRFIYDREDPRPYKHFRFSYLIATLMRMILK